MKLLGTNLVHDYLSLRTQLSWNILLFYWDSLFEPNQKCSLQSKAVKNELSDPENA